MILIQVGSQSQPGSLLYVLINEMEVIMPAPPRPHQIKGEQAQESRRDLFCKLNHYATISHCDKC
jgi:hypothetical protein